MKTAITEYRFNDAADTIYHFIWHQFCDWYLEWIKPVLGDENHSANHEYTRVAATVMAEAITMLHPLMPFITEELWKEIFEGEDMLISSSWPERDFSHFEDAGVQISFVFDIISTIRSLRNEMNIAASAKPDLVILTNETLNENWITDHRDAILRLARLNDIRFEQDMPPQSAQAVVSGVEIAIPLAGVLDFDAEKKRLSDALKATEIEVKKLESKLNNPGFVNKAPADVVEENKRRLDAEIEQRNKLDTAIKRLQ
jgi:valyl-tRNA synthetase